MHIYKNNMIPMTNLSIVYDGGGLFDAKGQEGTMHLMEHLICKTYDDLRDKLQENGISTNAYTNDNNVVFWFKGLDSKLTPELKTILVKRILGGINNVTNESFEHERSTVVEEYLDYFNDQFYAAWLNAMRSYYGYCCVLGLRKSIERFTLDDAKKLYENNFRHPVKIIEIGPRKTDFSFVTYAEHKFSNLGPIHFRDFEQESTNTNNKMAVIGLSKKKCNNDDFTAYALSLSILGEGLNSPLYKEIRETRGLSYFSIAEPDVFGKEGLIMLGSCTEKEKADELLDVYKSFFSNTISFINKNRFDICKNHALVTIEQHHILQFDYSRDLIPDDDTPYKFRSIDKVTYDDVINITNKYLTYDNLLFIKG